MTWKRPLERAKAAGGTVVFDPCDVMDAGRMAIIQDKEGAFLRLWYPLKHAGAGVMMEPGALCWFELATTDPESAGAFYKSVLQVDIDRDENVEEFPYWVLKVGDQMVGGIIQIGEDWGPAPPNWGVYFGVNKRGRDRRQGKRPGWQHHRGTQGFDGLCAIRRSHGHRRRRLHGHPAETSGRQTRRDGVSPSPQPSPIKREGARRIIIQPPAGDFIAAGKPNTRMAFGVAEETVYGA